MRCFMLYIDSLSGDRSLEMPPAIVPGGPLKPSRPSALAAANQRKGGATTGEIPVVEQEQTDIKIPSRIVSPRVSESAHPPSPSDTRALGLHNSRSLQLAARHLLETFHVAREELLHYRGGIALPCYVVLPA
jgi:hypothetical protein